MNLDQITQNFVDAYAGLPLRANRNQAFGILLHTKNNEGLTFVDKLGEPLAKKFANHILNQLGYEDTYKEITVDF